MRLLSCCRTRASRRSLCTYPLVDWLVCRVFKRRMMNTQDWSRVGKFSVTEALLYGWWSGEDRCGEGYHVDIVSDLLREIRAFQPCGCGTVLSRCSALSGAVSRSRACWRGVCRFPSSVVSSISVFASGQHVCCATPDATRSVAQGTQQGS